MTSRDILHNLSPAQSLGSAARTASADGAGVDLLGYESAMAVIDVGAWTDGTHAFELEESDNDSAFTAVADADLQGTEPVVDGATDDDQLYRIGYLGSKRYLRVSVAVTGSPSTGAVYGAQIVRGHKQYRPV
jgi:hypothetical protein